MAAVTSREDRVRRRGWLVAVVAAWIAVLAVLAVWSVDNEPPSVPEQRTLEQALPELARATGAVLAAAGGPGRAVVLQRLDTSATCDVTPVREGVDATRDVTVHVRDGEARAALDGIAAGLPAAYRAAVTSGRAGTKLSLHADAGNFIGIDADAEAVGKVLTVRVSTGCRPLAGDGPDPEDPAAGPPPAVLAALGAEGEPGVRAVVCPSGKVGATWTVDAPAGLAGRIERWGRTASLVRADSSVRAYRTGDESVVVVPDGDRLRVSVTSAC